MLDLYVVVVIEVYIDGMLDLNVVVVIEVYTIDALDLHTAYRRCYS